MGESERITEIIALDIDDRQCPVPVPRSLTLAIKNIRSGLAFGISVHGENKGGSVISLGQYRELAATGQGDGAADQRKGEIREEGLSERRVDS